VHASIVNQAERVEEKREAPFGALKRLKKGGEIYLLHCFLFLLEHCPLSKYGHVKQHFM